MNQQSPDGTAAAILSIPLNALRLDERNVRGSVDDDPIAESADTELVASIRAHGILENLVVVPRGKTQYGVAAGGRRLRALKHLAAEGDIAKDLPIPCLVVDKDRAVEASLAENTVRLSMHPADEVVAFSRLAVDGATTAEIADRFGVPERTVQRRVRLGGLHRDILDAYRAGEITSEIAEYFAMTADTAFQHEVFNGLRESGRLYPGTVKQAVDGRHTRSDSPLARFVGLDAYKAAGGRVEDPLFFDDYKTLLDPALLTKLATAKLVKAAAKYGEGWAWTKALPEMTWDERREYIQLPPDHRAEFTDDERARRDAATTAIQQTEEVLDHSDGELPDDALEKHYNVIAANEQILEQIGLDRSNRDKYSEQRRANAGVVVTVDRDGKLSVISAVIRKGDRQAIHNITAPSAEGKKQKVQPAKVSSGPIDTVDVVDAAPKPMSERLRDDLRIIRAAAIRQAMSVSSRVAIDVVAFVLCRMIRFDAVPQSYHPGILNIREEYEPNRSSDVLKASGLLDHLHPAPDAATLKWLRTADQGDSFRQFLALDADQRDSLLAHAVAHLLVPRLADDAEAPAHDAIVDALDIDMPAAFAAIGAAPFNAEILWSRLTKDQICAAVNEVHGATWAGQYGSLKKAELAAAAETALTPDSSRDAATTARVAAWLPRGLSRVVDDAREAANGGTEPAETGNADDDAESPSPTAPGDTAGSEDASGLPAFLTAD